MVAINSALQVDLTGQVCADSLGTYFYSGIGGQVDFIRGASRSKEGRPIIALPSTAAGGKVSRIAPVLTSGAGVVTSRGDVHYVVTEYGIANLHGNPIRMAELLATLPAPTYIERVAVGNAKHVMKTRKAIRKALKIQAEGKGYSFVEILSPCPTGWKMD